MVRSMVLAVCIASVPVAAWAQSSTQAEGPLPVSVVVRAESKAQPATSLQATDVKVEFDGRGVDAVTVKPLAVGKPLGARIEVALLIDDGLRSGFGTQLRDIETMVQNTVSPTVAVGVGYMRNGGVMFPEGFSTEAETELKAIRLPIAGAGIDGSPYFCLQDLVKKWPEHAGVARVVIMITSGVDRYNGSVSPMNQDSPYVAAAIKDAQKAGVPVYSIYYGPREQNSNYGSLSGQSYLQQMAEGTGGELFNSGTINPVSLSPYFAKFDTALRESYLLSFQTSSTRLESLKVKSQISGVKLRVQSVAGVPGAK